MEENMKILGVIPARYASTRLPGKPLVDICGKPMLWWVYNQAKRVKQFNEVVIATDDRRIMDVCDLYDMRYVQTSESHPNHISRVHEVATMMDADLYVCINGDEPALSEETIEAIIPSKYDNDEIFVGGLSREFKIPTEVIDPSNIKIALNNKSESVYMSRAAIPYPKNNSSLKFKKYVGVECFNRKALDFYVETIPGDLEITEDIDHLRFIENGIRIHFSLVESDSLSVDTAKDLDVVRRIIKSKIDSGELIL